MLCLPPALLLRLCLLRLLRLLRLLLLLLRWLRFCISTRRAEGGLPLPLDTLKLGFEALRRPLVARRTLQLLPLLLPLLLLPLLLPLLLLLLPLLLGT